MEGQLLWTRKEAAEALNMSISHFQRHVQAGLPCVSSGQLVLYRPADLEHWIEAELRRGPETELLVRGGVAARTEVSFAQAHERFVEDCRAGVALNNRGRPYKPKAIRSLDCALRRVPARVRHERLGDVARGELQEAVDDYRREGLSSSRIHTIICAVGSLYTWAVQRGRAVGSPATDLRLPAVAYEGPERIATPGEFAELLDAIPAEDALAWAIAGYATARHQEIEILDWTDVDFDENAILLAGDDEARKSEAARRIMLMVRQLRVRMRAEWERQGRPKSGPIFRPRRADNKSGTADLNAMLRRITEKWKELGLVPITFQDSRHTVATWLDHAGVSPKVASVIMGHKAPRLQDHPDAAPITLRRYTHVLKGELGRACAQLEAFLAEREAEESERDAEPALAA